MNNDDIRIVDINEIPESKLLKSFDNRQNRTFIIPILIGVLMLFGQILLKVFGLFFIAFSIFVAVRFKKKEIARVYEDYIISFEDDRTILIRWDDIKSWDLRISSTAEDQILIETNDNLNYTIDMFGISKVAVYFRKFAFDKNAQEIYKQEQNARGSSLKLFKKGK